MPSSDSRAGRACLCVCVCGCVCVCVLHRPRGCSLQTVQELWSHADRWDWQPDSIFSHIDRLACCGVSTKAVLEDVLGDLSDHNRESKGTGFSMERMFWQNAFSERLSSTRFLGIQPGDYVRAASGSKKDRSITSNRADIFGERSQTHGKASQLMKELCREGWESGRCPGCRMVVLFCPSGCLSLRLSDD